MKQQRTTAAIRSPRERKSLPERAILPNVRDTTDTGSRWSTCQTDERRAAWEDNQCLVEEGVRVRRSGMNARDIVFVSPLSSAPSTTTTSAACLWPVSTTCRSSEPCKWQHWVFVLHHEPKEKLSSLWPFEPISDLALLLHLSAHTTPLFLSPHSVYLTPLENPSPRSRLHSNNLQCDCHVAWLSEWLRQRPRLGLYTQCMAPPHLRGHNVAEVQKKEFVCLGKFCLRLKPLVNFMTDICSPSSWRIHLRFFPTFLCLCYSRCRRRQVLILHCMVWLYPFAVFTGQLLLENLIWKSTRSFKNAVNI